MKPTPPDRLILLTMTAITALGIHLAAAQDRSLGSFDDHSDIGHPKLAGSASYDAANQEYTLTAAGTNMWFGRDQFHFAWKKLKGDFILRTRFTFEGKGVDAHRKVGYFSGGFSGCGFDLEHAQHGVFAARFQGV